jgi:hypothetical protein
VCGKGGLSAPRTGLEHRSRRWDWDHLRAKGMSRAKEQGDKMERDIESAGSVLEGGMRALLVVQSGEGT